MAQLGQTKYYKTNTNGIDSYSAMPFYGNNPFGYQEISGDEYLAGIKSSIDKQNTIKTAQKTSGYVGENYDENKYSRLQKQLSEYESKSGIYAPGYIDPIMAKYQPNAPTPSEEYLTPSAFASLAPSEQQRLKNQYPNSYSSSPIGSIPPGMKQIQIGNSYVLTQDNNQTSQNSSLATSQSGSNLITSNLNLGSQGEQVKQLQTMLGITADGIYGPKTAAAVKAYQQANGLVADGIVGPNTIAKLNTSNSSNSGGTPGSGTGGTPTSGSSTGGGSNTQVNPQAALLGAIGDVSSNTYATGNSGLTLDEALKAAQNDPNIIAKYSDMLKLDTQSFQNQLSNLQQATSTDAQQKQMQFENDRRQLAENSAAAGQAYSGLRNRAQEQLGTQQSGIVESSRNTLKKSLQDLTTAFEQKYGTGASQAATMQFKDPFSSSGISLSGLKTDGTPNISTLSGQQAGGVTGTVPIQKQNDILNKGLDLFKVGQLPSFA